MHRFSFDHVLRDLSMRQLRAVAAVGQTGSLAGASKLLHVTAPAVSRQLRLAEEAAGVPLFDRIRRRLVPTAAGRMVVTAYARVESALLDCAADLRALRDGLEGRVAVGVVATAKYFMPHLLAAFRQKHPGIQLDIHVGTRGSILEELESYTHDVTIMGRPPEGMELVTQVMGEHPFVIIAAPSHRLVGRGPLTMADLASEQFLVRERASGTRILNENLFEQAGMSRVARMGIGSNETIKQGVMAGLGIAVLSAHTVAVEVAEGRIVVLPVAGLPVVRCWYLVRRADKQLSPSAQLLWDFAREEGARFLPELSPPA